MAYDSKASANDPAAKLEAYLRQRRLRRTPERFAILEKALQLNAHFELSQLTDALEQSGYHVCRATVYNTVEILCDAGILRRLLFDSSHTRYEVALSNHIHVVCTNCGKIKEIANEDFSRQMLSLRFAPFSPSYFSATVFGICASCARKIRRRNRADEAGKSKKDKTK